MVCLFVRDLGYFPVKTELNGTLAHLIYFSCLKDECISVSLLCFAFRTLFNAQGLLRRVLLLCPTEEAAAYCRDAVTSQSYRDVSRDQGWVLGSLTFHLRSLLISYSD